MAQLGTVLSLALGLSLLGPASDAVRIVHVPVPAAEGSGEAVLGVDAAGTPLLSWVEPAGDGHALRFSRLEAGRWSAPRTAARGRDWFVNWADRPSVVALADGALLAHWLVKTEGSRGDYGYGIRFAHSRDEGATWREVYAAGTGHVTGYSGFVSILRTRTGAAAVYLAPPRGPSGRPPAAHQGHGEDDTMTLRVVQFGEDGDVATASDTLLDAEACSCCTTALVDTPRGQVVAYRDRAEGEVRDISVVRHVGSWTAPAPFHRDGWVIPACPTNGPALAARGEKLAIAWFTAAHDTPRLNVAFSPDAGATFSAPVRIDDGNPVGWPAIAVLDDGDAAVAWLEATGNGTGAIRLRRVGSSGTPGVPMTIAPAAPGRSTGIVQMVPTHAGLLVAWRDGRVKTAIVRDLARD